MSPTPIGESSLLLWFAAALVALLASYLFVGWVRRGQSAQGWRALLRPVMLGSFGWGVGISASMPLALAAEALTFPLGYRWLSLPALVLGPIVAALAPAWWLSRRQNWWALVAAGVWLAVVAIAVQAGWILAAGLRPGIVWSFELLGAAALLTTLGFVASLWLAFSDSSSEGAGKALWRLGAAVLMTLTLIAGQEVVVSSVGLMSQVGSVYLRQMPSTWLCLVAGALLPTMLALMALALVLLGRSGRRRRHRSADELALPKRRKRRRKYRAL